MKSQKPARKTERVSEQKSLCTELCSPMPLRGGGGSLALLNATLQLLGFIRQLA